jgi:uncharacterized protein YukE
MATMYGADVQQLTDLAQAVDQAANQLSSTRQSVNSKVQQSNWVGPVADKFRSTWSSSGNSHVAAAAQLLSEASSSLRRNAAEQTQASSASGNFSGISLGGLAGAGGGGAAGSHSPWSLFDNANGVMTVVGDAQGVVQGIPDMYSNGWALLKTGEWSSSSAYEAAGDWALAQGPKWIGAIGRFMDTPGVSVAGRALGGVGAAFAIAGAAEAWTNPKSTAWNKTESTVGAALAVGALIPGPQEPFVAVAALGWAAGTAIYDNRVAIGQFASETATNVGHLANDVGKAEVAGATAAVHVATQAVQKGEQVATGLAKDVTGFFSGW